MFIGCSPSHGWRIATCTFSANHPVDQSKVDTLLTGSQVYLDLSGPPSWAIPGQRLRWNPKSSCQNPALTAALAEIRGHDIAGRRRFIT